MCYVPTLVGIYNNVLLRDELQNVYKYQILKVFLFNLYILSRSTKYPLVQPPSDLQEKLKNNFFSRQLGRFYQSHCVVWISTTTELMIARPYWTFPEGTEALMWVRLSASVGLFINFCCNLMVIIIIIFLGVIFVLDKPRKLSGQKSLGLKGPSTLRHHKMYLYIYILQLTYSAEQSAVY